jgi:hypothetical protein
MALAHLPGDDWFPVRLFDSLKPGMTKPLLLMAGEKDDFPQVHFVSNVRDFAATLTGPEHFLIEE